MKLVFVPNCKSNYDISDAERFGKLTIVTEGVVDIFNLTNLAADISLKLKASKEADFLIMAGAPIVNAICFSYLMNRHGRVNLLMFDARNRKYYQRTLTEMEVMI